MAKDDDTFRQERPKINPDEIAPKATPDDVMAIRKQAGLSVPEEVDNIVAPSGPPRAQGKASPEPVLRDGISMEGNMPPAMRQMLQERAAALEAGEMPQAMPITGQGEPNVSAWEAAKAREDSMRQEIVQSHQEKRKNISPILPPPTMAVSQVTTNDPALNALLEGLQTQVYEEVHLPSRGLFYGEDSQDLPYNGILHMRPMTGQDESILTTIRFMRQGRGIEMIFKNCLRETNINPEKLLSVDRTYLLIYLRGISFGNLYDVRVNCPDCSNHFDHEIDLNLNINYCPDDFDSNSLTKTLPESGYQFHYRLMTGSDEAKISEHREKVAKASSSTIDDTSLFRCAMLIEWIGNEKTHITDKNAIRTLLLQLPARDTNFIRNNVGDTPFGAETKIPMLCPSCYHDFPMELPYDVGFFFPREKESSMLV